MGKSNYSLLCGLQKIWSDFRCPWPKIFEELLKECGLCNIQIFKTDRGQPFCWTCIQLGNDNCIFFFFFPWSAHDSKGFRGGRMHRWLIVDDDSGKEATVNFETIDFPLFCDKI